MKKKLTPQVSEMLDLEKFDTDELVRMARLSSDLERSAKVLDKNSVRYLVKTYYTFQRYRVRIGQQLSHVGEMIANYKNISIQGMTPDQKRKLVIAENREQDLFMLWLYGILNRLELTVKSVLGVHTQEHIVGRWMQSITGIGPVLSAGFLAHINMRYYNPEKGEKEGCITPAKIWRYAGLDPTLQWKSGERRPFNGDLKLLCYKLGESFVKTKNNKDSFYGPLYDKQRAYDEWRNENGKFAELAKKQLETKNYSKDTEAKKAYMQGKLPPAHLYAYSKRKIVQLFISHLWEVWYEVEFGKKPPLPWIFAIGPNNKPHSIDHYIPPPNWPLKE